MAKEFGRDLLINGTGTALGGNYEHVKINGEGRVSGDMECQTLKIRGTSEIGGRVKAKFVEIGGTSAIDGDFETERMKVYGTSSNEGNLSVKLLNVKGTVDVRGNLTGEELKLFGAITVSGDCEAEIIKGMGALNVGGLLNAGTIDIEIAHEDSRVKEIGGESIKVRRIGSAFGLNKILRPLKLVADVIEGDDIYLEYTKSNVVRGNNVSIGPGCEIESVEYKNDFKLHKNAKVASNKKV
ncbi:MAG: polymer-forming cytoskeletal protein [Tumebacillaceae bacterium]